MKIHLQATFALQVRNQEQSWELNSLMTAKILRFIMKDENYNQFKSTRLCKTKFVSYGDSLSKGKSVAGYVVYEVDKNAKYEPTSHLAFTMTSKKILKE